MGVPLIGDSMMDKRVKMFLVAIVAMGPSLISATEGMSNPAPHPWRSKLVQTVAAENIQQTVENLPNFDDLSLAETSIGDMRIAPGNGAFQAKCMPRLTRVRKLLVIGREEPRAVVPLLRKKLEYAIEGLGPAREESAKLAKATRGRAAEAVGGPTRLIKKQT